LYAPIEEDVPTGLEDVIDLVGPDYAPNGDWQDFGATVEGSSYEREFDSEGYEIEQSSSAVFEEITDTSRTLTVPLGEFTPEALALLEEGTADTVASGTGVSAQDLVRFGSIEDLTPVRVAMIGRRAKASGAVVTETSSGLTRGAFVALIFKRMTIAADSSEVELAKGQLSSIPVQLTALPEPGDESGEEHGFWVVENPSTIAGS
jgi:hypothetical protein